MVVQGAAVGGRQAAVGESPYRLVSRLGGRPPLGTAAMPASGPLWWEGKPRRHSVAAGGKVTLRVGVTVAFLSVFFLLRLLLYRRQAPPPLTLPPNPASTPMNRGGRRAAEGGGRA